MHEPSPPAAELRHGGLRQLFFALVDAAKRSLHQLFKFSGWFATAPWPETLPVERMIPRLGCVVEYGGMVRLARGCSDNALQRHVREFGPDDQFVQRVDIGLVMPTVVEVQSIRGYDGSQCA